MLHILGFATIKLIYSSLILQVEISMRGQQIHPEMRLHQLVEMWIKTLRKPERKKAVTVGSSGKDFVMVFIYSLQL